LPLWADAPEGQLSPTSSAAAHAPNALLTTLNITVSLLAATVEILSAYFFRASA
jgi:hypothetical protein